ncbi:MAG: aldo/keto reductase, partial [Nitriliruptorales bacterium]|nr:aldo/keto reductase [Nitriliruptorales bacterium]
LFVTTKVWRDKASSAEVRSSHEQSLRRLGLDHVDLLLIHWPTPEMEVEEVVEALDQLRADGLTRLIGVSNYTPELLERALEAGPIATNQVEYHAFLQQDELLGQLREHDLTLTAYSPLAKGRVIGDETLEEIGANHGKSAAQVAIRWLLEQPGVLTIPRSSDDDHIRANFEVFDFELTDDERKRIDDLPKNKRQTDPSWGPWD